MEDKLPNVVAIEQTATCGKFVVEPLERGYGNTLGNTLRRVLLSSIRGSAVTAIKIDGVLHEFSTIDGIKEDATELLLNLKLLAVKVHSTYKAPVIEEDPLGGDGVPPAPAGPKLLLEVSGQGRVTAADIRCPSDVEIVNPELYLATISAPRTKLRIELFVGQGQGYLPPDKSDTRYGGIGVISIGAQFTPVTRANYIVEATRVGHKTDFERLILEVETNGTVTPAEAVSQAAATFMPFIRLFIDVADHLPEMRETDSDEELPPEILSVPETRIEELVFSQRTFNCLRKANLTTLRDLVQVSESDLTDIRSFGKKSLEEVKQKLSELGLELRSSKSSRAGRVTPSDFTADSESEVGAEV